MKVYTTMPKGLMPFYNREIAAADLSLLSSDFQNCWCHLERAHIIGQKYPFEHSFVHWKMLQFGFIIKSQKEIIGQIPRLLVGGIKSFVGHIPVGNTGGANVPPLQSMEIPSDIKSILKANS